MVRQLKLLLSHATLKHFHKYLVHDAKVYIFSRVAPQPIEQGVPCYRREYWMVSSSPHLPCLHPIAYHLQHGAKVLLCS